MNKLINMQTKIDSSKPGGKCRKARLKCSLGLVEREFAKELSLYQLNLSPEKLKQEKPKRYLQKKEPILLCLVHLLQTENQPRISLPQPQSTGGGDCQELALVLAF